MRIKDYMTTEGKKILIDMDRVIYILPSSDTVRMGFTSGGHINVTLESARKLLDGLWFDYSEEDK